MGDAMSRFTRRTTPLAAIAFGALGLALGATPASARTTTLHFFQKETTDTFSGPDGKPIPPPTSTTPPAAGDRFVTTDDDYAGNHKHHAAKATATDHLVCTFTNDLGQATCDGQIAIGGSMLLAENVSVDFAKTSGVPLNGGTGVYKHAHGATTSVGIANTSNSDFTIRFTT
jgi:hypothetical protein